MKQGRTLTYTLFSIVVLIGVVQALLSSLASGLAWPYSFRQVLNIVCFFVDTLLVCEFFMQSIHATRHRKLGSYLGPQLGWVDALAALPLLVFVSGPTILAQLSGISLIGGQGSAAAVLQTSRILDLGQALYLLRLLKLVKLLLLPGYGLRLGGPKRGAAGLAVALVGAAIVLSLVRVLAAPYAVDPLVAAGLEEVFVAGQAGADSSAAGNAGAAAAVPAATADFAQRFPGLLLLRRDGLTLYKVGDIAELRRRYGPDDYLYMRRAGVELYYSLVPSRADQALVHLQISILLLLAALAAAAAAASRTGGDGVPD